MEAISFIGPNNWGAVAGMMQNRFGIKDRSGKKCRERWINHLRPDVSKSLWTENEAEVVFLGHALNGNQWTEIAKMLPGRTDNSVKNFFYSALRRRLRSYNKSVSSDMKIWMNITELSLDRELTKKVLQASDKRMKNKQAVR
jgi:transcription factor MYB, plant